MFASLARRNFKIWGTEWPSVPPFDILVQEKGRRLTPVEYVKIFNASKINLNLHSSMERDGVEPFGDFINPRTFELAACGAFQLLDPRLYLPEQLELGKEAVTFRDSREMEQLIDYYLAHPEERQQIAMSSRSRVLREHTYRHRLEDMLGFIYADRYEQLSARAKEGPWPKTLESAERFPELHTRLRNCFERGEDPKLDSLVADIQVGKGELSETEQKLMFLHHIRSQIAYVQTLRRGKAE